MKTVFQVAGLSDIGNVRVTNEDNFGYDTRHGIFLVCDGMGGQAAGERASKLAVEIILAYFRDGKADQGDSGPTTFAGVSQQANSLGRALQLANHAIHEEASHNPAENGMGSTIVAVLARDKHVSLANVGDSRIYLLRDNSITQLTQDHSLVMEQVRRGLMTMEEAESSALKNIIVRSLGVEEKIEPDLQDRELAVNDTLLLCSDGLSRFVSEQVMLETVAGAHNLEQACAKLIAAAKTAQSDDNITCLLVRLIRQSPAERVLEALLPGRSAHKFQGSI